MNHMNQKYAWIYGGSITMLSDHRNDTEEQVRSHQQSYFTTAKYVPVVKAPSWMLNRIDASSYNEMIQILQDAGVL